MTDKEVTATLIEENSQLKGRVKELETTIAYVERELQEFREATTNIQNDIASARKMYAA